MVDGVFAGQEYLRYRDYRVAVGEQGLDYPRQRLRSVLRGIVEQHDAARLHLGGHPLADGVRVIILPVEGVPIGNDLKPLRCKGLRVWG